MNQYECYNCVVVCVVLVTFCSTSSSTSRDKSLFLQTRRIQMMTTYALDVFHDEMLYSYSRNHNVFS